MPIDFHRRKKRIIIFIVVTVILSAIVAVLVKSGIMFNKVSLKGNFLESLVRSIPGVNNTLKGEKEGRINVLLLGMRGERVDGGGLLADTIMVVSIKPAENKVSMISVPRDLYVTVPGTPDKQKINSVYFYGEEKERGGGIDSMKQIIGDVTGQTIHYAMVINFAGFEQLVDSLGGIDLKLSEPFIEPIQFHEKKVCDPNVFTVPANEFEYKRNEKGRIVAQYPLCYNANEECGGIFQLPAGDVHLNGDQALCYVRSRATSSDFDRARRQQVVIQQIKSKALSIGTLSDLGKINDILNALAENTRTDMDGWEIKRFWELYGSIQNPDIRQKVLENSEEGLLYAPENTNGAGYILLPRGDTYDQIHELFNTIFN